MDILYFVPFLRVVLGCLLIITASLKFPNLRGFSVIVASYGLLPRKLVRPLAYTQPFIEFVVGWWVLSGEFLVYSSIAGLALMVTANVFVLFALVKRKRMENCGCYGVDIKVPLSWKKFAENCVWILLFVALLLAALKLRSLGF